MMTATFLRRVGIANGVVHFLAVWLVALGLWTPVAMEAFCGLVIISFSAGFVCLGSELIFAEDSLKDKRSGNDSPVVLPFSGEKSPVPRPSP